MKRAILLAIVFITVLGLIGYVTYQKQQEPKPVATTVSIEKYNDAVATTKNHDAAYEFRLKQAAQDLIARDKIIQTRTAQRDSLCATYKGFRPVPTPAQCQ